MKLCLRIGFVVAIAVQVGRELPARADESPQPWEKSAVAIGGAVTFFSSELTFGVQGGGSSTLNAEDLLGLDSRLTVFRAGAMYRPGASRRHQLDFSYAGYDRHGSATLTEDVVIDGVPYPVGAQVETVFNFDIIRGTYSFAFWQDDRMRIALGLGVYVIPLEYRMDIATTGGDTRVEGANTTLPLPTVALRGEFQLIPKLFLNASVDGMYLELDEFKGAVLDLTVGLEYRPWKHVGVGLGYNFMGVQVEGESGSDYPGVDFAGEVDVRFSGLLFYGKNPLAKLSKKIILTNHEDHHRWRCWRRSHRLGLLRANQNRERTRGLRFVSGRQEIRSLEPPADRPETEIGCGVVDPRPSGSHRATAAPSQTRPVRVGLRDTRDHRHDLAHSARFSAHPGE